MLTSEASLAILTCSPQYEHRDSQDTRNAGNYAPSKISPDELALQSRFAGLGGRPNRERQKTPGNQHQNRGSQPTA